MRWPWQVRPEHQESVKEAERQLEQLQRQEPKVDRLTRELEARRRANRFSEAVREAFGGQ